MYTFQKDGSQVLEKDIHGSKNWGKKKSQLTKGLSGLQWDIHIKEMREST